MGGSPDISTSSFSWTSEIVESLPFGVILLAPGGEIMNANANARGLLEEANVGWAVGESTCCTVFGCGQTPGLVGYCVAELAAAAEGPLPEIRIDLPVQEAAIAVWMTASRIGGPDDPRLLVHLRRGMLGDRRRRTRPHWTVGPRLRIDGLGPIRIQAGESEIGGDWLLQRPGQLLRYLVCQRGRPVHVDELVEQFCPEVGAADTGRGRIRHLMHVLRSRMEPGRTRRAPSSFVLTVGSTYALAPGVAVDLDRFERLVAAGLDAPSGGSSIKLLKAALDLYRGDLFCDDRYSVWLFQERERLRTLAYDALAALVQQYRDEGDLARASEYLERGAELWPLDTSIHRSLIALHLDRGRQDAALGRYEIFAGRSRRELGREPAFLLSDIAPGYRA